MTNKNYVDEKIYCFWTGDNPITHNRGKGLESMRENLGVPIEFLDKKGIEERILPDAPLHPGYRYLSCIHKSDYLRCYFMHHFGGGYADIKNYSKENNWKECFEAINRHEEVDVIGTRESITGARRPHYNTEEGAARLLVCGFFICRAHTDFTNEWYRRMLAKMDEKYEMLRENPAQSPMDRSKSYPMKWTELHGMIFHDLLFEFSFTHPGRVRDGLINGFDNSIEYR